MTSDKCQDAPLIVCITFSVRPPTQQLHWLIAEKIEDRCFWRQHRRLRRSTPLCVRRGYYGWSPFLLIAIKVAGSLNCGFAHRPAWKRPKNIRKKCFRDGCTYKFRRDWRADDLIYSIIYTNYIYLLKIIHESNHRVSLKNKVLKFNYF